MVPLSLFMGPTSYMDLGDVSPHLPLLLSGRGKLPPSPGVLGRGAAERRPGAAPKSRRDLATAERRRPAPPLKLASWASRASWKKWGILRWLKPKSPELVSEALRPSVVQSESGCTDLLDPVGVSLLVSFLVEVPKG